MIVSTVPFERRLCAIVVTYGDRYALLERVVQRLVDMRVSHTVVVFNGNHNPERVTMPSSIISIMLPANLGSSGGFRAGIDAALHVDADYFLLLDDDNLPALDCIDRLFTTHERLGGSELLTLQAFRPAQPWQRITARDGVVTIGRPNTYGYFNLFNERHLLRRQLAAAKPSQDLPASPKNTVTRINVAAYGGLFLHRRALLLGELPDPRYFCYYDDLDFTDRLTRHGVCIYLSADAIIDDLDTSWHAREERAHPVFSANTPDMRVYLDLRNAFIFYRSRMTNRFLYLLNGVGFWLGIAYLALFRSTNLRTTLRRLRLIRHAVRHGTRGEFAPCPP